MSEEWISVEDRLPENSNRVLGTVRLMNGRLEVIVCFHTMGGDIEYYDSDEDLDYLTKGWWEETEQHSSEYDNWFFDRKVTHWMPLPEPPK